MIEAAVTIFLFWVLGQAFGALESEQQKLAHKQWHEQVEKNPNMVDVLL